ncbi:MAG: hypothetical protein ACRELB_16860 [Polyangiaceae bacterium]
MATMNQKPCRCGMGTYTDDADPRCDVCQAIDNVPINAAAEDALDDAVEAWRERMAGCEDE